MYIHKTSRFSMLITEWKNIQNPVVKTNWVPGWCFCMWRLCVFIGLTWWGFVVFVVVIESSFLLYFHPHCLPQAHWPSYTARQLPFSCAWNRGSDWLISKADKSPRFSFDLHLEDLAGGQSCIQNRTTSGLTIQPAGHKCTGELPQAFLPDILNIQF